MQFLQHEPCQIGRIHLLQRLIRFALVQRQTMRAGARQMLAKITSLQAGLATGRPLSCSHSGPNARFALLAGSAIWYAASFDRVPPPVDLASSGGGGGRSVRSTGLRPPSSIRFRMIFTSTMGLERSISPLRRRQSRIGFAAWRVFSRRKCRSKPGRRTIAPAIRSRVPPANPPRRRPAGRIWRSCRGRCASRAG